jgi:Protein of unknown function (DUF2490)
MNRSFRGFTTSLSTFVFLGCTLVNSAFAKTTEDFQTWGNITATGSLSAVNPVLKNFKYWLEGQGRFGLNTSAFSQGMVRTGLGYQLNDQSSIWLGYAWVPTDEPFTKTAFDEHRVWEQFLWSDKYSWGTLTSRSRLEQRFIPTDSQVGWRFRQMVKASIPMPFAPDFSFVASDEYFANLNKTNYGADDCFDQNRAFAGIGYNFNKSIKTEVDLMNQYIRKPIGPDRMDNILSVNLYLNY